MFVFIWTTLLFSVRGSNAYTGTSVELKTSCHNYFCITLPEELTAEAGLCVVIPCSFTTRLYSNPLHAVWYKCSMDEKKCVDADIIFHSNNNNKVRPGFRGRVSLLEPNMSRLNCSIVINDLQLSDSGGYQFRVIGNDRFQFNPKAFISVKGLDQKPTVEIPPLKEGREATLTCTAPGLSSGSVPEIIWRWSGAGGTISGNITTLKTENLNAVANIHSSTLTFNSSAEHHGTNVTCRINFSGSATTEETVTLNVTYVEELEITGDARVKEHETLNLTCSVESFPPSQITWMKNSDQIMQNGTETILQNDTSADFLNETETQERSGRGSLFISNVTTGDSGEYICIAKYLNRTMMEKINVTVLYRRKHQMTGNIGVVEGNVLNLTCSAESFPPSLIIWTKLGCNTTLHNDTGSASLVIPGVTEEDSGQYVCTALYLGTATAAHADVAVTYIHKSSRCELQSDVLTCVCVSEGIPLPTIKWPLLNNHIEYSIITAVSNHTVNSTVSLTVITKGTTSVECVSGNENGNVTKTLPVQIKLSGRDDPSILGVVSRLEIIVAFLVGVLLSAIVSFLVIMCYRRKQKNSGKLDENVELVTNNNDPLLYYGQAVEDDQPYDQEEADDVSVAAEKTTPEVHRTSKDVEYANIDFSLLKRKSSGDGAREDESTKTEYAEIKKEVREVEESEMLEGKEEEVEKEVEETRSCLPEEETAEMEAVYSNVKEVMDEI